MNTSISLDAKSNRPAPSRIETPRSDRPSCAALQYVGFRVTIASDGPIALEEMQSEVPAIVVMDLEIPNIDGAELLKRSPKPVLTYRDFRHRLFESGHHEPEANFSNKIKEL